MLFLSHVARSRRTSKSKPILVQIAFLVLLPVPSNIFFDIDAAVGIVVEK
jgi:hypothetical protein